jgi:hypothetical protein
MSSLAQAAPFNIIGPTQNDVDTDPATVVSVYVVVLGGEIIITDLNLEIAIGDMYTDNLDITLSHLGASSTVYFGEEDTEDAYMDSIFDDEALVDYPKTGTVDGTFKPSPGVLSVFDGLALSGLWQLTIFDHEEPFDGNDLTVYRIFGEGNQIPIPGAVWLLGSGLIGLIGLRKKFKK